MITVIGSLNIDLTTIVDRYPKLGETLTGTEFRQNFGGKGANQAIAASRAGSSVSMVGRVGADNFGREYITRLKNERIIIDNVEPVTHQSTGTASITVAEGDNLIIVVPGANYELTPADIEACEEQIKKSNIVLLQLEIRMETVEKVLEIASEQQVTTVLNPAPFQEIPAEWWDRITYLTPNEHEAEMLFKSSSFREKYKQKLIITNGKNGVFYYDGLKEVHIQAPKVEAVDTTGAGDTFNGVLCSFLDQGYDLHNACYYATHAASLSVTKLGAQSGMPTLQELKHFMKEIR